MRHPHVLTRAAVVAVLATLGLAVSAHAAGITPDQGPTAGGTAVTVDAPSAFVTVASGDSFTLGLTAEGLLFAWGSNERGQLGIGTTVSYPTPVAVALPAGTRIVEISAGHKLALAVDTAGNLYAWGANESGQVGNGTTVDQLVPQLVTGLPAVKQADASSGAFSLALTTAGDIYAWGANETGQLGDGTADGRSRPVAVDRTEATGVVFTQIGAGSFGAVALGQDGLVYTWGSNQYGQLGNGTTSPTVFTSRPARNVASLSGVTQIAAGDFHNAARIGDTVYGWGYNGRFAILGGSSSAKPTPVVMSTGVVGVVDLVAGYGNTLVRTVDGAYTWGWNTCGQIGTLPTTMVCAQSGLTSNRYVTTATRLDLPLGVRPVDVALGYMNTVVATTAGATMTLGWNNAGQLGNGTSGSGSGNDTTYSNTPQTVVSPTVSVTFDGIPATTVTPVSGAQVTAVTPAHPTAAVVDVAVLLVDTRGTAASAPAVTYTRSFTYGSAPVVGTDPSAVVADDGQTATFTAAASSDGAPTAVWQMLAPGAVTWTAAQGTVGSSTSGLTTTSTLAVAVGTDLDATQYRAVFSNPLGSATSQPAVLTVRPFGPVVAADPQSAAGVVGTEVTFTSRAEGYPAPTARWQVRMPGSDDWSDVDGQTAPFAVTVTSGVDSTTTVVTVTATTELEGAMFRAVYEGADGTVTSGAATLEVLTPAVLPVPDQPGVDVSQDGPAVLAATGLAPAMAVIVAGALLGTGTVMTMRRRSVGRLSPTDRT